MSTPQARVIDAAVRTFSDNAELKLAATELLAGTSGNLSQEAIARWDAVDANMRGPVRRWLPWGILAVVSALMWLADSREMIAYFQWVKWARDPFFTVMPPQAEQRTAAHLDAWGKLLVFGDLASQDKVERKEKLWQSDPENPAYFAEYAAMFASKRRSLPPDFLQTARRLAPDNAWFTYLAAAVEARDAVQSPNEKAPWQTLDQAKLDRALALLRDARTQTKCTSYAAELLRQRLPLLPHGNLIERHDSVASLASATAFSKFHFLHVSHALAAGAWGARERGDRGDVPALQEITRDGDHFLRAIYQDEVSNVVDEMVSAHYATTLAQTFAETTAKLGLREEADGWKKIADDSTKRQNSRRTREFELDGKVVVPGTVTGSMLGGSLEQLGKRLTLLRLTDADVKPGRLLDHEILSRFFNYICWLVMALCLGLAAMYRFRVTELSRRVAARMAELLRPADWAWIVGLGILLPFAFVMGINRLTPLGGRAFGMKGTFMLMPAGHFLGLLVLWLVVPVQIIRWRLARRAGGFGFSGPSRIGWVAVACAVAFVPWIGWAAISESFPFWWVISMNALGIQLDLAGGSPWIFWQALGLLGIPVLWLAGVVARALFCRADRQLHRATAARVLVFSSAAALGVLCIASQGFKASEHYWFAREGLGRMDPAQPGWSVYEYRVAAQLRKEMRDILGYDHH